MIRNNSTLKVRLNDYDRLLFKYLCAQVNKSESAYMRMLIDKALQELKLQVIKGELKYEDVQAFFDNQLQFREIFGSKVKRIGTTRNS